MDWLQGSVLNEEEQRRVDAYWAGYEAHRAEQTRKATFSNKLLSQLEDNYNTKLYNHDEGRTSSDD